MGYDRDGEPLNVLIIEDNRGDVHLIRKAFEESCIDSSVTVVPDGEEALDYLYQRNEYDAVPKPDLVLLDLNVPKVRGRTVLTKINNEPDLQSIPVIVLSGSTSPDDIHDTRELGAVSYFTKPLDPNEYTSLVQTIGKTVVTDGQVPLGEYADIDQ